MFLYVLDANSNKICYFLQDKIHVETYIPFGEYTSVFYHPSLFGFNNEYSNIYVKNQFPPFPSEMQRSYEQIVKKLELYKNSFLETCQFIPEYILINEIIPEHILIKFCQYMEKMNNLVFQKTEKPNDYSILLKITKIIKEIECYHLSVNNNEYGTKIKYDPWKSTTGRMGLCSGSFPISNLPKTERHLLPPSNDLLVEFDYNSAEIRTLLALSNKQQPLQDIHEWHMSLYQEKKTREEIKSDFYKWLYGNRNSSSIYSQFYKTDDVVAQFFNGEQIETPFGRVIKSDEFHALSYIIQSTTSDLFFESLYNVLEYMKKHRINSHIAWTLHDSVVFDMYQRDMVHLENMKNIFSQTSLGTYLVNVSQGKNYGQMERINEF